jgi:hypothetical protein
MNVALADPGAAAGLIASLGEGAVGPRAEVAERSMPGLTPPGW